MALGRCGNPHAGRSGPRESAAAAAQPPARPGAPSNDPYMNAVFEAAQYVDASDPTYTWILYKPGEVRNMPVLRAGNVAAPGLRTYQVWYRNAAAFCTPSTFNLTNGWETTWMP